MVLLLVVPAATPPASVWPSRAWKAAIRSLSDRTLFLADADVAPSIVIAREKRGGIVSFDVGCAACDDHQEG